jgi:hypothetical protein
MAINCKHCQGDVESQFDETLASRLAREAAKLKAKDDELKLVSGKLTAAQEAARAFDAERAELADLRKAKARAERVEALKAHGIPDTALDEIELLFEARMAQRDEAERVGFADFLGPEGEARKSVLLSGYFGAAPGAAPAPPLRPGTPAGAAPPPPGIATANGGAAPPGVRQRPASTQDLQAYFASPEFKALPSADKRAKLAELQAKAAVPGGQSPV